MTEEIVKDIGVSAFSSAAVAASLFYLFKRALEKWIDRIFERQSEEAKLRSTLDIARIQAELDLLKESSRFIFQERLRTHREVVESVYRIKTAVISLCAQARSGVDANSIAGTGRALQDNFSEILYRSRFVLSTESFGKLHKLKQLLADIWTTLVVLRDAPEMADLSVQRLNQLRDMAAVQSENCIAVLKSEVHSLGRSLLDTAGIEIDLDKTLKSPK